ncbi:division/cell wall cluster transcriptional repressor MraZ [Tropicibacter naphthalenivorans]|uniref:Transcriptional regulator MraZ n=1 Tax=Tropicibacter naphthalenivorans TaxID=441103 RepID=A0A0P1G2R7_9RHOB|nr:division/cell wall cluster transcriptional repressor MraZ [Tropicibacter naphthalenivorans]CUH76068.1 cell division protein MraZ [Tropicibacter naphthalenivorans]SMC40221.1 MraZ protein [Tropicibacter naphthalenivorans]
MGRRLRFRGEFTNKVDTKGRVSIPAPFRRVLEAGDPDWAEGQNPNFVIVYGDHRRKYLECYTIQEMEDVEDRISRMKRGSQKRRILERLFSTQSLTTSVDETGRIVLPAKLRDKIGISNEAQFASNVDTFQIWQPDTYREEELGATEEYLDEQDDDFDPLMLLDEDDEDEAL